MLAYSVRTFDNRNRFLIGQRTTDLPPDWLGAVLAYSVRTFDNRNQISLFSSLGRDLD